MRSFDVYTRPLRRSTDFSGPQTAVLFVLFAGLFLANLVVTRTERKLTAPAYVGLFVSLVVGYGLATSHTEWAFGPPLISTTLQVTV